ncbi:MAG: hypothetical protein ACLPLR_11805 [Terriglobales bacterium]
MRSLTILRTALFVSLIATIAAGADKTYQKGTVTKNPGNHVAYDLSGPGVHKLIGNCADFQTGQTVDYRVEGNKVYIRQENGKEYKCNVEATYDASPEETPITYQKGTIMGFFTRYDPWGNGARRAKAYELKGPDMVYEIDYCGSFQAGEFQTGQAVDYRVDASDKDHKRLYIRRDDGKEYNCKVEGTRLVEGTKPEAPSTAPAAPPSTVAPPAKT